MSVNWPNHAGKGSADRRKREIRLYCQFAGQRAFYFLKKPWHFPSELMFQNNLQCSCEWHQLAEPGSPWSRENILRAQSLHGREANPQAHHMESGRLWTRCIRKSSWSLLNWMITSLLLKIKLLFRNLYIYAPFLSNWVWRVFGPTSSVVA